MQSNSTKSSAITTNWTKEELQTYAYIYCMNADFSETEEQLAIIKDKVSEKVFDKIHTEFKKDNDYQSIQKIMNTVDRLNYSEDQIENLFEEIRVIFKSDGKFHILERNLDLGLKKLLK